MKTKSSHERRVAKYKWERDRALADLAKERESHQETADIMRRIRDHRDALRAALDASRAREERLRTEPDDVEGGEPDWVATAGSGLSESGDEPDDAERAARELLEWWGRQRAGIVIGPVADERLVTSVAALVRARDAQAREAGWNAAVEACAKFVDTWPWRSPVVGKNIRAVMRPDRAKGGAK